MNTDITIKMKCDHCQAIYPYYKASYDEQKEADEKQQWEDAKSRYDEEKAEWDKLQDPDKVYWIPMSGLDLSLMPTGKYHYTTCPVCMNNNYFTKQKG